MLAAVVESSDDAIITKDLDGIILSWNRAAERIFGYSADEAIGNSVAILAVPGRAHEVPEILERVRRGESVDHFETLRRRKDGSVVHVSLTVSPVRNQRGEIIGASKIARDVTARKRMEQDLRDSEARFRGMVEASAEGIWILDPYGVTTFVNRRLTEMLGYEEHEIVGRPAVDFLHPDERQRGVEAFEQRKQGGDFEPREYRILRSDGSEIWLSVIGSAMYGAGGSLTGVVEMCTDITERRRNEQKIRDLNRELGAKLAELETLVNVVPVGIVLCDHECRSLRLNPAAQKMLGVGDDCELSQFRVRRHGAELPLENWPMQISVRTGKGVVEEELEVILPSGKVIYVLSATSPLLDEQGKVRGAVGCILDVTARKNVEDGLRRANVALEQFAYAAAHDLQEPVRNVVLYSQLLAQDYAGRFDAKADKLINVTVEGARRMQALIQDLLSYARAGSDENTAEAFADANVVAAEVVQNLRTAIDAEQASVEAAELPLVAMRHGHLLQVLQNLVSNGLKYRRADAPRIEISAMRQGAEWIFTVRDNGQGISPEHHHRIFGVFKRLHGRDVPGTGIGLAICERVVTHYGGRIWVESEAGRGSAFRFTVPALRGAQ